MTSIHTDNALLRYFSPSDGGLIPAFNRKTLDKEGRRELVEALIDYYLEHESASERPSATQGSLI